MKVIKNSLLFILECLVTIEVLICIGELPILFANLGFHLKDFVHSVTDFSVRFFTFQPFTYHVGSISVPLFPTILQKYFYSIEVLALGILTASAIAFLFTYLTLLLFRKRMDMIKKLMELGESIPDLIFILFVQMLVIFIYKKTGVRVARLFHLIKRSFSCPSSALLFQIVFILQRL